MNKEKDNIKYYKKDEYLPKKLIKRLIEDIFSNNDYEYRTKNNLLKCVGIIYHKQINEYHDLDCYVPTGRSYWKKVFGGDYHKKVIAPLLELGIIQSYDFGYRTFVDKNTKSIKGKPKGLVGIRYRINPDLIDDECEVIEYNNKGKLLSAEEIITNDGKEFIIENIPNKNFHVSINLDKTIEWIEANAEKICNDYLHPEYVGDLPDNLQIEYHKYVEGGSYNPMYSTIRSAKFMAEAKGKEFFFFKNNFYIANVDEFLKHRIAGIKYYYKREISKVGVPFIEKRSPVTLRLHNYLVNFPSKILQFITINNKTIFQFDLRTSQFLLFANLLNLYLLHGEKKLLSLFKHDNTRTYLRKLFRVLKDHKALLPSVGVDPNDPQSGLYSNSDVIKFIRDIYFEDFYTVVQKELKLSERGLAKQMLFKLLFKKTNKPDELLNKLSKRYSVAMSIIAGFKEKDKRKKTDEKSYEKDQESNFSVFLQCIESEIFIDNILIPLREKRIPCFSRHDSIVIASGYEKEVENFIKSVFEDFGFRYNYTVEDKFWEAVDHDELEESGYMDWLDGENELESDYLIDDSTEKLNENLSKDINVMDEQQLKTLERLREIGVQDDYYEFVDAVFLEEISELPFLTMTQRNYLCDDVINLQQGMSFLQKETNNVIGTLIKKPEIYY